MTRDLIERKAKQPLGCFNVQSDIAYVLANITFIGLSENGDLPQP
ncbi:hypothetical protein ABNB74_18230 [Paenibacillus larvae]